MDLEIYTRNEGGRQDEQLSPMLLSFFSYCRQHPETRTTYLEAPEVLTWKGDEVGPFGRGKWVPRARTAHPSLGRLLDDMQDIGELLSLVVSPIRERDLRCLEGREYPTYALAVAARQ